MTKVIFSLLLLIPLCISAQDKKSSFYKLQKCIAQEEQEIHNKKDFSARYKLNQSLLNHLIKIPNATISKENLLRVCHAGSPGLSFLYLLFTNEKLLTAPKATVAERAVIRGQLKELKQAGYKLFLNYIHRVQASLPTADCLTKYIPPLGRLFQQNKFLAPLVGQESIFSPKELAKILKKMKSLSQIRKRCLKDQKRRLKQKTKAS